MAKRGKSSLCQSVNRKAFWTQKYLDKNMAKQYNLQAEEPQAVAEAVQPYGITIPVTIPDVGG